MDENSELEEGEACFHEDEDDNVNPDTAFSYIDEKIKHVLGHFQNDFEGGVSAENLGAKFGCYGSFLPTYERSPPRLSRPKTPQRNSSASGSTNSLSMEDASQNLKAPPNAPPTWRPGNTSCLSGNIAAKHDSHLTSAQVAEKSALKDKSFDRAGIPSDQKTLKLRIKMGSDKKAQKVAAIYSGLGLDYSPSSSLGNSPDESGGTLIISQETTSESPTRILQVMTSNHVPGGVLISPLHDSLLCLLTKEKERQRENKSTPLLKASQEDPYVLIDESILGNRKQVNEKKTKLLVGKREELVEPKLRNRMNVESGKILFIKKKHGNEIAGSESLPSDLKQTALSNSVNIAMEATARFRDVSAEVNQNTLGRRLVVSSDSGKEDSLESISGRSRMSGKKKKRDKRSSLDEQDCQQSVVNSNKNASLDLGDSVGQIATFRVQNKINIPSKKEKTSSEGKEAKGGKNNGYIADSMKESLKIDMGATLKDTTSCSQGFSSGKGKIEKLKLQKDICKVHDNPRDALETNFEQKSDQMHSTMRHFQNRAKDSGPMDFETEQSGYFDKLKVIFSGKTGDNQQSRVGDPGVPPCLNDKTPACQTAAPAAVAPVVIEENWVQCDRCQKWRLLPFDTRPEQLPEKWLCSMLNWLPRMNRCDFSEEETTKALNALYQVPVAENQNNPQNHANGTVSLVNSAPLQHLHQNKSSQALSFQGKKNRGLKEVQKAGSSGFNQMPISKKNQQQESLKSSSVNGMTQVPVESTIMKKSANEEKARLLVGGETKKAKMKNKRESGLYASYEGSKKAKIEVAYTADKLHSSNLNHRRVGLKSSTNLETEENGRSVQDYNECSDSGDVKHDIKEKPLTSVRKLVDQTQPSTEGGSLDMRICDKRAPVKKRKLEAWQDSQNENELCMKEESSESLFRNEKKLRFSKIEGKQSHRNDDEGISNRKSADNLIGGIGEVGSIDRNKKLSKHKKSSSQKGMDGLDSLRRDSGTRQILIAATSSSSKFSGSRKAKANFEEARSSPVESVSSSPMRTSYPEKLASTVGSGHDAAISGILSSGNFGRCWNGEGASERAQSGTEMKEVSGDINPRSQQSSTVDRDSIRKISIRNKPSSRLGKSHLRNGDTHSAEDAQHTVELSHSEDRLNKECSGNALFSQKSDIVSTSQTKDRKRNSAADKMKGSDSTKEQENLCSKKSTNYQSDVDPKGHACIPETFVDCKRNLRRCSEDENNYFGRRNPSGQPSSDSRMGIQSKIKHDEFDVKSAAPCSTKGNNALEKKMIQDLSSQTKVTQLEVRSGMPKSSLHSETESSQEKIGHRTVPEAQKVVVSGGVPVHGSSGDDVSKALKQPGKASSKNCFAYDIGQHMPDFRKARDLNPCSPVRVNSSSLTGTDALNDAKGLKNYADLLKTSGFVFESNESYFQAALKFLGVATLLETSNSESVRHGDMNQMQVYGTAIELCEMCAQEYEKRQEMAAAALSYKCLEVAYMRVVYCKNSSSSRDLKELQATLQMVPQGLHSGESPSSSVSDVDNNLNNQATMDKAPLAKGNVSHVAGTHALVARNRPSVGRLLDFTQDVNFAMEASRKSQTCFIAATLTLEEAQNIECITSIKKVIDFSFQDVDGLISLVQQAVQAISRSVLGSTRD